MREKLRAFFRGMILPWRAFFYLLRNRGLKRWAVMPLVMSSILYAVAFALFVYLLMEWRLAEVNWEFWGGTGAYLSRIINYGVEAFKWTIIIPPALMFCYLSFTTVGMVIASPFNDILSERVERKLCTPQEKEGLPLRLTIRMAIMSIIDSAWIVTQQVFCSLLVVPFMIIPVVGFVPFFLVGAYFVGIGFADVAMVRNHLRYRHKRPVLRDRFYELLGLGVMMEIAFMIPLMGLLMLPVGVISGTILYCSCDWEKVLKENQLDTPKGFILPVQPASTPIPAGR